MNQRNILKTTFIQAILRLDVGMQSLKETTTDEAYKNSAQAAVRNLARSEKEQQGKLATLWSFITEKGLHNFQSTYACKSLLPLEDVVAICALHV